MSKHIGLPNTRIPLILRHTLGESERKKILSSAFHVRAFVLNIVDRKGCIIKQYPESQTCKHKRNEYVHLRLGIIIHTILWCHFK